MVQATFNNDRISHLIERSRRVRDNNRHFADSFKSYWKDAFAYLSRSDQNRENQWEIFISIPPSALNTLNKTPDWFAQHNINLLDYLPLVSGVYYSCVDINNYIVNVINTNSDLLQNPPGAMQWHTLHDKFRHYAMLNKVIGFVAS